MRGKGSLKVLKFDGKKAPTPYESVEVSENKPVTYGRDNLYPNYLLKLFNECGPHASIIENKVNYIIGAGMQYQDGKPVEFKANASDTAKELVSKLIKDYLIFNYFVVEVVYNVFGAPVEFHHVPAHLIRTNKSKTKFWYNEDWTSTSKKIQYERWSRNATDTNSKIFFFDGYFPSINKVYPLPEYHAALESIVTDIAIKSFNKNNIKNHFSVSSIITFFSGSNVSDEAKEQALDLLEDSYSGEHGKKIIVDYQEKDGKGAEVKNLSPNDWDKAYQEVGKKTSDDIFIAHQITSPILFGVKTEGQLGGATELETSFHIFKNTYVIKKREDVESALNQLFANFEGVAGKVKFGDKPLFPPVIADTLKEKVMTINEIRKEAGLPPIADGDRLLSATAPTANPLPTVSNEEDLKKKSNSQPVTRKLTEEDYEKIKDMGSEDFEIISEFDDQGRFQFDAESDVSAYIVENDIRDLTLDELNSLIKKDTSVRVTTKELKSILDKLHKSGVVNVAYSDGKVKVIPSKVADVPDSDQVFVMYKYEKRPGIAGPDLLPTSRSFCVKLINNNRLYTRAEIQQMSALFGYDIYQYCGGFYYNPETDETRPYCRHIWKAYSVKRKHKNNP